MAAAYDWVHSGLLNNVHTSPDGDFSQVEQIIDEISTGQVENIVRAFGDAPIVRSKPDMTACRFMQRISSTSASSSVRS